MTDSEIINEMGGTCAVAALCELTTGAISQWRHNGIPNPWRKYFRVLRPDLFPPSENNSSNGATK